MRRRSRALASLVLAAAALSAGPVSADGPIVEHEPVDCIVAGRYPLLAACFQPADQVARGRVYFQPEGATAWYFVEMKSAMPCWAGVLPKPSRALVDRHVRYYIETTTRSMGSARTSEYDALVVRSAEECKLPKVAAVSTTGPASVQPFLPGGFTLGGLAKPLVFAGAGVAVGGAVVVARPSGGGPDPVPTPLPPPASTPPQPTPTPNPSPTPPPGPTPTPTPAPAPTPAPTPTPAPGALSATCTASPQSGVAPLTVQFTVTPQGGTGTYTYAWVFGDGGTSAVPNPTHAYTAAGNYVPAVQVTSGSEKATCSNPVTVTPPGVPTLALTVSRQGAGSGTVTSTPAGIACGATCTASYPQGTTVSLTAQPDAGSLFGGWSGACSGVGACTVTMDAARTVSARFDVGAFTLRVTKTPLTILGTVTSAPAGINCGLLCPSASASFPSGTVVTLTAQAILTASFRGWSGDCGGSGACVVTMDGDKSVNADFSLLFAATSHLEAGSDVDLGPLRSLLRSPGARGEVTLNGHTVLVTREGEGQVALRAQPGNNLVEAWVHEAAGAGLWRFELDPAAIEPGSLRVLAGEPLAVAANAVTFRLKGRAGERVAFAVRARARRTAAVHEAHYNSLPSEDLLGEMLARYSGHVVVARDLGVY